MSRPSVHGNSRDRMVLLIVSFEPSPVGLKRHLRALFEKNKGTLQKVTERLTLLNLEILEEHVSTILDAICTLEIIGSNNIDVTSKSYARYQDFFTGLSQLPSWHETDEASANLSSGDAYVRSRPGSSSSLLAVSRDIAVGTAMKNVRKQQWIDFSPALEYLGNVPVVNPPVNKIRIKFKGFRKIDQKDRTFEYDLCEYGLQTANINVVLHFILTSDEMVTPVTIDDKTHKRYYFEDVDRKCIVKSLVNDQVYNLLEI